MYLNHTLPIFINKDSKVLILGSFPSVKSRELGFYYSHKMNRMFPILASIFKEECPSSVEERKVFASKHNIAFYDVIEKCDITNSDDSSIRNVVPIDIVSILKKYPNIEVIGVTGKKASSLFKKYLQDKVDIKVIHLPSTSSANAKISYERLIEVYTKLFINL